MEGGLGRSRPAAPRAQAAWLLSRVFSQRVEGGHLGPGMPGCHVLCPPPQRGPVCPRLTDGIVYVLHRAPELLQQWLLQPWGRRLRRTPRALAPPLRSSQELFQVFEGAVLARQG